MRRFPRIAASIFLVVFESLAAGWLHADPRRIADAPPDPLHPEGVASRSRALAPARLVLDGLVSPRDPDSLACRASVTFDDLVAAGPPGANLDAVFESGAADFGERFAGQALGVTANHDVLSADADSPLAVVAGAAGRNLDVLFYPSGSNVLTPLGPLGFPAPAAIGEGSFAVLFDYDQSEIGFDVVGGDGGDAHLDFYRRDGSRAGAATIAGLADGRYAFRRDGGVRDIAGFSLWNDDLAGIGIDNLCHDVAGVIGHPPRCESGGPYSGFAREPLLMDGGASVDPDGGPLEFAWEFGDGATALGSRPSHVYATPGGYAVRLCVSDRDHARSCCETRAEIAPPRNRDPECGAAVASPANLWPPDHRMAPIAIQGVSDPDGDPVTIVVTGITEDEPPNGVGDGNTCPDASLGRDGRAWVRAERGAGRSANGRFYSIAFTATDGKGGSCRGTVCVCVPHDRGHGGACVDDGQRFDAVRDCAGGSGSPSTESVGAPGVLDARVESTVGAATTIEYTIPTEASVELAIFDIAGRRVATLVSERQGAGKRRVAWGAPQARSGAYFLRLWAGRESVTRTLFRAQ